MFINHLRNFCRILIFLLKTFSILECRLIFLQTKLADNLVNEFSAAIFVSTFSALCQLFELTIITVLGRTFFALIKVFLLTNNQLHTRFTLLKCVMQGQEFDPFEFIFFSDFSDNLEFFHAVMCISFQEFQITFRASLARLILA